MSWRKVDCGISRENFKFRTRPICIKGVAYWATRNVTFDGSSILAVDLADETSHHIGVPEEFKALGVLEKDNYLSIIEDGPIGQDREEVRVWVLKDLCRGG
ncbi:hypothetical protein L1049_013307 [Liquidambar formosana]|uniref:F-box associated domain-containing protein n=1 Tax=Liquidambar formosana TaxID=63359 RepID=A0AAP0RLP2_LIQFO